MGVNRDDGSLLQSIESILRQTHNDLEFIIVNDGSSEDVKGLVSEILDDRIVLINCVKIGLTAALNIALKKSKGKYIARHDAGDYSLKDRLNDALEQIEISLETKLENRENDSTLESLISENEDLKRQVDSLKAELENSSKDREAHSNIEGLSAELSNLKEEREQEKKELQSLYDQLSAALAASGETV